MQKRYPVLAHVLLNRLMIYVLLFLCWLGIFLGLAQPMVATDIIMPDKTYGIESGSGATVPNIFNGFDVLRTGWFDDGRSVHLIYPTNSSVISTPTTSVSNTYILVMLLPNGSIDKRFGQEGFVIFDGLNWSFFLYGRPYHLSAFFVSDDWLYIGVVRHQDLNGIIRFSAKGELDQNFGLNGVLVIDSKLSSLVDIKPLPNKNLALLGRTEDTAPQYELHVYSTQPQDNGATVSRFALNLIAPSFVPSVIMSATNDDIWLASGSEFLRLGIASGMQHLQTTLPISCSANDYISTQMPMVKPILTADRKIISGFGCDIFYLMRYQSDGILDRSFGNAGVITLTDAQISRTTSLIALYPTTNQKLLVVVSNYWYDPIKLAPVVIFRFNVDGTPDLTFGKAGKLQLSEGIFANLQNAWSYDPIFNFPFNLRPDGNMSLFIKSNQYQFDYSMLKVDIDSQGKIIPLVNKVQFYADYDARPIHIFPLREGGYVLISELLFRYANPVSPAWVPIMSKFLPNGQLDSEFGNQGLVILDTTFSVQFWDIFQQSSGKIVVSNGVGLQRVLPNGANDPTFDQNAIRSLRLSGSSSSNIYEQALSTAILPNDNFIVTTQQYGCTRSCFNPTYRQYRFDQDGKLIQGQDRAPIPESQAIFSSQIIPLSNGEMYVGRRNGIARVKSDLTPNIHFGQTGVAPISYVSWDIAADESIRVLSTDNRHQFTVTHIAKTGVISSSFVFTLNTFTEAINIQLKSNAVTNKFDVIYKNCDDYLSCKWQVGILRFEANGTPDIRFGFDGKLSTSLLGNNPFLWRNEVLLSADIQWNQDSYKVGLKRFNLAAIETSLPQRHYFSLVNR